MKKVKFTIETEVTEDYYASSEFQKFLDMVQSGEAAEELKGNDVGIKSLTISSEVS